MNNPIPNFPKGAISEIIGTAISLRGNDIDTDRIIPARFLKCVNFDALGSQVFDDDRKELNGLHPFDLKENQNASILVVNGNFGCGSSREHAPQALMRWGINAVIGQSFAEIFFGNCLALGIPCFTTSKQEIEEIQKSIESNTGIELLLNLKNQTLKSKKSTWQLEIDPGAKQMLTSGQWDATNQLISNSNSIDQIAKKLPYINGFKSKDSLNDLT